MRKIQNTTTAAAFLFFGMSFASCLIGGDEEMVEGRLHIEMEDANERTPNWFPDGKRILLESDYFGDWELYTMNVDEVGSERERLTFDKSSERQPALSPDAKRVVFQSNRNGPMDLFILELADKKVRQLTSMEGDEMFPHWSPDGQRIAFTANKAGNLDLYVTDAEGKSVGTPASPFARRQEGCFSKQSQRPDGFVHFGIGG